MGAEAKKRREYWVAELEKLSGSFGDDYVKLLDELRAEITKEGWPALIDHLRVCGALPERYRHDSSEEKLYSKYTDAVIAESFACIGLKSVVLMPARTQLMFKPAHKTTHWLLTRKLFV